MTKYKADIAIPPGETLEEQLEVNNMSQKELANRIDVSKKHINQIVNGKAPITAETAIKLERVFSLPASFWTNLESNYRETLARLKENQSEEEKNILKKLPYKDLVNKGWLNDSNNIEDKINNLRKFFKVSNLKRIYKINTYNAAYRTSEAYKENVSVLSLTAWLEQGKKIANEIETKDYAEQKLKDYIKDFRKMTLEKPENFYPNLLKKLADCGIAFVLVPHIKNTYAQGAVKWLSPNKVMMQLTLRHKFADVFWFSFFHELGHILLHGKREEYIDYENDDDKSVKEKEADEFAAKTLIPAKEYQTFINKNDFSQHAIKKFANEVDIGPYIVLGRLIHDGYLEHYMLNSIKVKYNYEQFKYKKDLIANH